MWGKLLLFYNDERVVLFLGSILIQLTIKCQIKSMKYIKFNIYNIKFLHNCIYKKK
jgi:hypothetical protein